MRYLSQEEQECIQFFEDTIVSLEESLDEDDKRPEQRTSADEEVDRPLASSSDTMPSFMARPLSPKDHDIIDLVRPEPDLVQTRDLNFIPTNPGSVLQLYLLGINTLTTITDHFVFSSFQTSRICCRPLKATLR